MGEVSGQRLKLMVYLRGTEGEGREVGKDLVLPLLLINVRGRERGSKGRT